MRLPATVVATVLRGVMTTLHGEVVVADATAAYEGTRPQQAGRR